MIQIDRKKNRIRLRLKAIPMGRDLCVIISGGDAPHLGAVTVCADKKEPVTEAFASHKDHVVTELAARILRREYDGNFAVCCGIHLDQIEKQEIEDILEMSEQMVRALCRRLKEGRKV
jgi:hypothetical protein